MDRGAVDLGDFAAIEYPGAFLAALLFAVHPVNVESVAWISQRKGLLAAVFFLLSILWYVRAEEPKTNARTSPAAAWYWLSLLAFVMAMLSKGSVAILPFVLLLVVWWLKRRIDLRMLMRTAPFFLVAVVLTGVNIWFQTHGVDLVVRDASHHPADAGGQRRNLVLLIEGDGAGGSEFSFIRNGTLKQTTCDGGFRCWRRLVVTAVLAAVAA